jgi:hypothetical protein
MDELLAYLFDGQSHLLATQMAAWLASSRRFAAFVTNFRTKIRKKLRATQGLESLLDLQLELESAYLLLQDRSLSLVYEPLPIGQVRGPDFAVTFTTSMLFMVEVTRLRTMREQEPAASPHAGVEEQLADAVCGKLGQLLPQHRNILLVGVETPVLTQDSLRAAMLHLQQRAERNEAAILRRHRFRDRADFFHHYQRLSELLVHAPHPQAGAAAIGWVNPQAKNPLPGKVRTAVYRSLNIAQVSS